MSQSLQIRWQFIQCTDNYCRKISLLEKNYNELCGKMEIAYAIL